MRRTNKDLTALLAMVNQGRASHGKIPLHLEYWNDGRARRYILTDGMDYRVSPNCTAREMYAALYVLDDVQRPWGGQA